MTWAMAAMTTSTPVVLTVVITVMRLKTTRNMAVTMRMVLPTMT